MTIAQTLRAAFEHRQAGRLAEAENCCRQILALETNHADALHLLGLIAHQVGRRKVAVSLLRQAIAANPAAASYHNNLGLVLDADAAIAAFRTALRLQPDLAEAHNNLGNALRARGQAAEAIAEFSEAIAIKPDYAEAHNNLGIALREEGRIDEAIAAYERALEFRPDLPAVHNNLGNALAQQGRFDAAIAEFEAALRIAPDYAEAQNNLGNARKDFGQLDEALACYRKARSLQPGNAAWHSNLLYTLEYLDGADAHTLRAEQARWNEGHGAPLRRFIAPHRNDHAPGRRLRIGYVSPDFWHQAECHFVVPLLEAHDREHFAVHAYSSVRRPDFVTARLRKSVEHWRDVLALSDEQLAAQIRADGIDILVDLTMHMRDHRLLTFARKPAPVQVSWLAYPGRTGLETIDYRLTDALMEPADAGEMETAEEPMRLPDSWCCYEPVGESPAVAPLPALQRGHVTFGSLNNFCKLNDSVLRRWARLLAAVDASRLLLLSPEGEPRARLRAFFENHGVGGDRLDFESSRGRRDYLNLYARIDIGLDPFPYNGITTTCDALWMGVPVLTLPGVRPASRAGLSLLTSAGLPEWAAHSEQEHAQLGAQWASDIPRLAQLRAILRPRMQASSLMDARRFARNVEAAYREMWRRWRASRAG